MAYDEDLAQRVRTHLAGMTGLVEKKMFGGVGFLINGNMACGVNGTDLILRVGSDRFEQIVSQPHVRVFDMTGKPMKGWLLISPGGYESEKDLQDLVQEGVAFARTLPPK